MPFIVMVIAWVIKWVTSRVLIGASVLTMYYSAVLLFIVAFILLVDGLLAGLLQAAVVSSSFFQVGLSLLPHNIYYCIDVILSAHMAAFFFLHKNRLLKFAQRVILAKP
ncbi:hypothetical protein L8Q74_01580 [Enterobacter roggenkampii]|nr:hypothetical protein [Enterobacter roggenkampii]